MIETGGLPCGGVVTSLTGLGKAQGHVVWVRSFLKIGQVTSHTIRRCALEFASYMAGDAIQRGMGARESKSCHLQMIEFRSKPVIHAVTLFASRGKPSSRVCRRTGRLVVFGVAGVALRGQALELANRRALMASVAFDRRVSAQQRETILMLLNLLHRHLPSLHRMALLAVRAHLALVNVGVAVCAFTSHVGEHRIGVALGTAHTPVHAPQWIARLIVIEFGDIANGLPSAEGVTILARDIQLVAVRTARIHVALRLPGSCGTERHHHEQQEVE